MAGFDLQIGDYTGKIYALKCPSLKLQDGYEENGVIKRVKKITKQKAQYGYESDGEDVFPQAIKKLIKLPNGQSVLRDKLKRTKVVTSYIERPKEEYDDGDLILQSEYYFNCPLLEKKLKESNSIISDFKFTNGNGFALYKGVVMIENNNLIMKLFYLKSKMDILQQIKDSIGDKQAEKQLDTTESISEDELMAVMG